MPAGAPLQADLALLSWKKVEDLSGDGGVIKKTLHAPEGWQAGALLRASPAQCDCRLGLGKRNALHICTFMHSVNLT